MNEIFFLVFAFLTIFLSVKLSYYADNLSKNSGVSGALIGGVLLAGVTSLPEFVTCFSAIFVNNPSLAMGDILGSNMFNIFTVCFFDLVFFNKMFFTKSSTSHNLVLFVLFVNYIVLSLFIMRVLNFSFLSIGIPSIFIFLTYIIYIKSIPKFESASSSDKSKSSFIFVKLFVCSILMVLSSVCLTIIVNNLSNIYPSFSSSFLGAILLGVTTSLPEVITFYTLICIDSYDLALFNIFGSNLFNLFVLAIGDLFFLKFPIYNFSDKDTFIITMLGLVFTFSCLISNFRKNVRFNITYILPSLLVFFLYLSFWILTFLS